MIDLKATNKKLQQRSRNIIRTVCGPSVSSSDEDLDALLLACEGSVKLAIATIMLQVSVPEATERLRNVDGILANLLDTGLAVGQDAPGFNSAFQEDYVLCVDGGGSKCAAVVLGSNGEMGRGESGGCNV